MWVSVVVVPIDVRVVICIVATMEMVKNTAMVSEQRWMLLYTATASCGADERRMDAWADHSCLVLACPELLLLFRHANTETFVYAGPALQIYANTLPPSAPMPIHVPSTKPPFLTLHH